MFEKFFEDYYVPEQELKERIYSTLERLTAFAPDQWPTAFLELASPEKSTGEIIQGLISNYPLIAILGLSNDFLTDEEILRSIEVALDTGLEWLLLDDLLVAHMYKLHTTIFLELRYALVTQIMVEKLGWDLKYDRDTVSLLLKNSRSNEVSPDTVLAIKAAKAEMNRFFQSEQSKPYKIIIESFEGAVIEFIRDNYYQACRESFGVIFTSSALKNLGIVSGLGISLEITESDKREVFNDMVEQARQMSKARLNLPDGRGGSRPKRGFVWTQEKKLRFYEEVKKQPTIGNEPMWEYAYRDLNEKNFDYKIVDYFKTSEAFKGVSEGLFHEAVRTWMPYKDIFSRLKPEEKPLAFSLRHALHLLGYPYSKYSTIRKYYGHGKKLFQRNNLNQEKP